jgi:hypothetical protein
MYKMRATSFAFEKSKAGAATEPAKEAVTLGRMSFHQVLEDRVTNFVLKAVVVLARFPEIALIESPRNVSDPYLSHQTDL